MKNEGEMHDGGSDDEQNIQNNESAIVQDADDDDRSHAESIINNGNASTEMPYENTKIVYSVSKNGPVRLES